MVDGWLERNAVFHQLKQCAGQKIKPNSLPTKMEFICEKCGVSYRFERNFNPRIRKAMLRYIETRQCVPKAKPKAKVLLHKEKDILNHVARQIEVRHPVQKPYQYPKDLSNPDFFIPSDDNIKWGRDKAKELMRFKFFEEE